MPRLTVVVPIYNEAQVLAMFHRRLAYVLDELTDWTTEILYVNDGSKDQTLAQLEDLQLHDARVSVLNLSRHFGKSRALSAGLDHADADAVIVMDADLQDPPELIPEFLALWCEGYDVVHGKRVSRKGESRMKKLTAFVCYRLLATLSRVSIAPDTGDFRLLSRRALDAIKGLRERHRYMKELYAWIGFRQTAVPYARKARAAGKSKYNTVHMLEDAMEGITSFSILPLRVFSVAGLVLALGAFMAAAWIAYHVLALGESASGYPTLMVALVFLSGAQLLGLGMIGEYLGRIFNESRQRPLYLVECYTPALAGHHVRSLTGTRGVGVRLSAAANTWLTAASELDSV
ncbi:glycosyltransferase [Allopusillimonas ginsengisoli]|nr:glycosyltransferase [Allopusillimonas ginsengisoli]